MPNFHVCVWLDRFEARLFEIPLVDGARARTTRKLFRGAEDVSSIRNTRDEEFLERIAANLSKAEGILISGPGRAKTELSAHLHRHHPRIHENVWAIQAMDHFSDRGIAAIARKYFRTALRMQQPQGERI